MKYSEKLRDLLRLGKKADQNPELKAAPADDSREDEEEVTTRTKIKVIAALLVVGFAAYVAWWVQEPADLRADVLTTEETGETSAMTSEAVGQTMEVSIIDFAFDPDTVSVEKGTTVIWTNKDTVPHTVTGPTFTSGTLNSGESYSFTFEEDATFEYHCSFHPQMKGTVVAGTGGTQQATQATGEIAPVAAPEGTEEMQPAAPEITSETPVEASAPVAPEETSFPPPEEIIFPEDTLAVSLSPEELLAEVTAAAASAAPAAEVRPAAGETELPESGPEDVLYLGLFGVILFLNRKRVLSSLR